MRYLLVTWDGGGNLHCVLPLARRLACRGHELLVLGNRSQRRLAEEAGCSFAAFDRAPDFDSRAPDGPLDDWRDRSMLATSALYRDKLMFGPAPLFAADVLAAVERWRPDAIVVDYFLFGALAGAEASGLPTAACWHTVYARPDIDVPVFGLGRGMPRRLPGRAAQRAARSLNGIWWRRALPSLNATRAGLGLSPLAGVFEQFDRLDRILVMTSPSFDFAALSGAELPANVRYVGPQIDLADGAPCREDPALVLVSLSTTYQAQEQLLNRVVGALGRLPVRGLVTTGPAASPSGPIPTNVEVRRWASHSELLPRASLTISHAGHGTAIKSLANGVPLVCVPMGRDQPCVAARVEHAGAGVRLGEDPGEGEIEAAIRRGLGDPALKRNAERLGARIRDEIREERGVEELEALSPARGRSTSSSRPRFPRSA